MGAGSGSLGDLTGKGRLGDLTAKCARLGDLGAKAETRRPDREGRLGDLTGKGLDRRVPRS